MRMRDALQMATDALAANPVRSLLTMLGIVIGVGCVVCMAAIGAGARARVIDQIRSFGANVLLVNPRTKIKDGVRGADAPKGILTTGDAKAIAELPLVALRRHQYSAMRKWCMEVGIGEPPSTVRHPITSPSANGG